MRKGFSSYDSGLMFYSAFELLFQKYILSRAVGDGKGILLVIPALVNGSFACELFLKALLAKPTRGHRLYSDLYCKLDSQTASEIEHKVIDHFKNEKNTIIDSGQFRLNFMAEEKDFEELRYFYEPGKPGEEKSYNVDFVAVLVVSLKEICEQRVGQSPLNS